MTRASHVRLGPNLEKRAGQRGSNPSRVARVTAPVRFWALSFPMMEFTWNLTVCSLTSSREATPLLGNPSAKSHRTSFSLGVNGETASGPD